jgi:hypothetical protein
MTATKASFRILELGEHALRKVEDELIAQKVISIVCSNVDRRIPSFVPTVFLGAVRRPG